MADKLDKHDGTKCEKCAGVIRLAEVQPVRQFLRPFSAPLDLATYECTGEARHRWTYYVTWYNEDPGVGEYKLIPEEDFKAGPIPSR